MMLFHITPHETSPIYSVDTDLLPDIIWVLWVWRYVHPILPVLEFLRLEPLDKCVHAESYSGPRAVALTGRRYDYQRNFVLWTFLRLMELEPIEVTNGL